MRNRINLGFMFVCVAIFAAGTAVVLTSCNLYGGLDKPSGDDQLISAARACLDNNDYECANRYYAQVSNDHADVRISETVITTLKQNDLFSYTDFIGSLGSSRGTYSTLLNMSQLLAGRGKQTAANRVIISQQYVAAAGITDPHLKAYTQFIVSLAMFNAVLANAAGPGDNTLTSTDLVSSAACLTANPATCAGDTNCDQGNGVHLDNSISSNPSMSTPADWNTTDANLDQLVAAASAANTAISVLDSGSTSGIFSTLNQISTDLGVAGDRCKRQAIGIILFP